MSNEWWIRENGENLGPHGVAELKRLALAGKIHAETPVRNGADGAWVRADRVKGLLPVAADPVERAPQVASRPQPQPQPQPQRPAPLPASEPIIMNAIDTSAAAKPAPRSGPPARPASQEFVEMSAADEFDFGEPSAGVSSPTRSVSARKPRKKSGADTTKVIGIVCAVIAFVGAFAAASQGVRGLFGGSVESKLKAIEVQLNKDLPKQIDHLTRWDRVEAGPGKKLTYFYTVDKSVSRDDLRSLQSDVTRRMRSAKETQVFFREGVVIWYKYYDKSGKKLHEFSVKGK